MAGWRVLAPFLEGEEQDVELQSDAHAGDAAVKPSSASSSVIELADGQNASQPDRAKCR